LNFFNGTLRVRGSIEDAVTIENILTYRNEKTDFTLMVPDFLFDPQHDTHAQLICPRQALSMKLTWSL